MVEDFVAEPGVGGESIGFIAFKHFGTFGKDFCDTGSPLFDDAHFFKGGGNFPVADCPVPMSIELGRYPGEVISSRSPDRAVMMSLPAME